MPAERAGTSGVHQVPTARSITSGKALPKIATKGMATRHPSITKARTTTAAEDCSANGDSFRRQGETTELATDQARRPNRLRHHTQPSEAEQPQLREIELVLVLEKCACLKMLYITKIGPIP
ncbi:MAG: hypothetical protein RBS80_22390, partial [Thermoguttaceae bacterium]|nr:hypothetical protein [Thermoguttaceae bacterium]